MATKRATLVYAKSAHDQQLERVQDAAMQCGLTFAVLDNTIPGVTVVTLRLPSMKTPQLYGVVTAYGFSLNLQDLMRLTGPEKNKLKDVFTTMTRA